MSAARLVWGDRAGLSALTTAFNRGFSDYKYGVAFDTTQMARFLENSGVRLADSAVLLVREQEQWVGAGCALLAVDGQVAWCGGLAVAPEERGQGHARQLMAALHQRAGARGARRLMLEVLVENAAAHSLYQSLGYRQKRRLFIWEAQADGSMAGQETMILTPIDAGQAVQQLASWRDQPPAWQRSAHHLRGSLNSLEALLAVDSSGRLAAIALCHAPTIDKDGQSLIRLGDVGVNPAVDIAATGSALFAALFARHPQRRFVLLNEPEKSGLNPALEQAGFRIDEQQVEMQLELVAHRPAQLASDS